MEKCVSETKEYNDEFPEKFNWELVDQKSLSLLGSAYSNVIRADLLNTQRNLVPGLRSALRIIADIAIVVS